MKLREYGRGLAGRWPPFHAGGASSEATAAGASVAELRARVESAELELEAATTEFRSGGRGLRDKIARMRVAREALAEAQGQLAVAVGSASASPSINP